MAPGRGRGLPLPSLGRPSTRATSIRRPSSDIVSAWTARYCYRPGKSNLIPPSSTFMILFCLCGPGSDFSVCAAWTCRKRPEVGKVDRPPPAGSSVREVHGRDGLLTARVPASSRYAHHVRDGSLEPAAFGGEADMVHLVARGAEGDQTLKPLDTGAVVEDEDLVAFHGPLRSALSTARTAVSVRGIGCALQPPPLGDADRRAHVVAPARRGKRVGTYVERRVPSPKRFRIVFPAHHVAGGGCLVELCSAPRAASRSVAGTQSQTRPVMA